MLFLQFVDDDLGCGSYLVGDEQAAVAVVVDPAYRIEPYLEAAETHGVRIVAVLETHTHADHVSGHGRLALEHGVPVRVHAAAEATFPHEPLADGEEIEVGDVVIRVVHTPGHRPEHCAFVIDGRLVLTGDSLFVGDAARPDLAIEAREGAEDLYHSLQLLAGLGDAVEVYPGHVAGSLCGATMSSEPSTTIGRERRSNHALNEDLDEFIGAALGPQPPRPPNMERIVELNRGEFLAAQAPLAKTSGNGDEIVLDVRPAPAFGAGHVAGAVNVPVSASSFATKAAFVLPERRLLVHAADEAEAVSAVRALQAVAIFDVAGWDVGGGDEHVEPVTIDELDALLDSGEFEVLDVREADERDAGYIPGTDHMPYRKVRQAAENGLVDGKPILTICESGARAALAASVLKAAGIDARPVVGGIEEWRARGGEVTSFRRCGGSS
ncbi:MAG TPA: MBL fold metallo-hydrolase [Gaiellaceae bacterium]|nr:MBL fold metallo-hydrolase [Gaiellaceae bacterium]